MQTILQATNIVNKIGKPPIMAADYFFFSGRIGGSRLPDAPHIHNHNQVAGSLKKSVIFIFEKKTIKNCSKN